MGVFFSSQGRPKVKLHTKGKRQGGNLEAILDTGFDGFLSLPITTAVSLGLELIGIQPVEYADGRTSKELVFSVEVNMEGKWKTVPTTLTSSSEALVGTALLADYELSLNFHKQKVILEKV